MTLTAGLAGIVILADDLSGAAETAAALAPGAPGGVGVLLVRPGDSLADPGPGIVALDTDSRYARPDDATRVVIDVMSALAPGRLLLKKVDSLLRGNIGAEVTAITGSGRTVLFAPALPRLNRVVRDGRPWVDGEPLADAAAWRLESSAAPTSLLEMFPDAVPAPLATVRDASGLRRASRAASGSVLVCDSETDADLDRIASAALELSREREVAVAGSSALAAALGRLLGAPDHSEIPAGAYAVGGRALFVVGTAEPRARAQVAALQTAGARVLALDPRQLLDDDAAPALVAATRVAMEAPVAVLTLADGARSDARSGAQLCRRMAELVATGCSSLPPALLTLTGGETARAVLDALSVRRLTVRGTINDGAALSITDRGMTVVTRPGSFGADDDFLRILERVSPSGYATLRQNDRKVPS